MGITGLTGSAHSVQLSNLDGWSATQSTKLASQFIQFPGNGPRGIKRSAGCSRLKGKGLPGSPARAPKIARDPSGAHWQRPYTGPRRWRAYMGQALKMGISISIAGCDWAVCIDCSADNSQTTITRNFPRFHTQRARIASALSHLVIS